MELAKWRFQRLATEWCLGSGIGWLDGDVVRKLFTVPDHVSTIWLTLYDRPGKNRVQSKVRMMVGVGWTDYPFVEFKYRQRRPQMRMLLNNKAFDRKLRPLAGRTVYVEIEYWE